VGRYRLIGLLLPYSNKVFDIFNLIYFSSYQYLLRNYYFLFASQLFLFISILLLEDSDVYCHRHEDLKSIIWLVISYSFGLSLLLCLKCT
jgi:hypothetical protein